jgi:alcohol dehydrogenase/propanol-preferring alcohol dehydrogenase
VAQSKLDAAKKEGATDTILADGHDTAKKIIDAAGGPVGAIVDLVNGTDTSRFAFDALRKGGKLIQVGLFGGEMNIPLPLVPIRALTIQGSYVGNVKELRELVGIAQAGKLPAIPITNMPLNQADAALNRLKDGKVVGRIVLTAA